MQKGLDFVDIFVTGAQIYRGERCVVGVSMKLLNY